MTKDRSGNRSRRWCAAPIPETPAPTMRTSTWPPSSTCSVSGAFTGDVVVMVRAYVAIAGIRDCRSLLRFPEPRRGGRSDGQRNPAGGLAERPGERLARRVDLVCRRDPPDAGAHARLRRLPAGLPGLPDRPTAR